MQVVYLNYLSIHTFFFGGGGLRAMTSLFNFPVIRGPSSWMSCQNQDFQTPSPVCRGMSESIKHMITYSQTTENKNFHTHVSMIFNKNKETRAKTIFSISGVRTPQTPLPPRRPNAPNLQGGATKVCIQFLGILQRSQDFLSQNHLKSRVR